MLYGSGENLRNHVWATLWVPVALSLVVFWIAFANRPEPVLGLLVLVSSVYLAWHYAGQTWGMVSTFSRLANFTYTDRERFALHLGPRCLLALHVILALYGRLPPATWIAPETWGTVYAFVLYMDWVLSGYRSRTGCSFVPLWATCAYTATFGIVGSNA